MVPKAGGAKREDAGGVANLELGEVAEDGLDVPNGEVSTPLLLPLQVNLRGGGAGQGRAGFWLKAGVRCVWRKCQ